MTPSNMLIRSTPVMGQMASLWLRHGRTSRNLERAKERHSHTFGLRATTNEHSDVLREFFRSLLGEEVEAALVRAQCAAAIPPARPERSRSEAIHRIDRPLQLESLPGWNGSHTISGPVRHFELRARRLFPFRGNREG